MSDPVAHVKPLKMETLEGVALDVIAEVERQDKLARAGQFGKRHILPEGPDGSRLGVLVEEVGEVAEAMNEEEMGRGDPGDLYSELIQTAACALAWAAAKLEELEGYRP